MSLQRPVTKKEFAREVFVGIIALGCLFAIFLYVVFQKSTGRNLSPLAYLFSESFADQDERIPVVVFRNDQDRIAAIAELAQQPGLERMAAKSRAPKIESETPDPRPSRQVSKSSEKPDLLKVESSRLLVIEEKASKPTRVQPSSFETAASDDSLTDSDSTNFQPVPTKRLTAKSSQWRQQPGSFQSGDPASSFHQSPELKSATDPPDPDSINVADENSEATKGVNQADIQSPDKSARTIQPGSGQGAGQGESGRSTPELSKAEFPRESWTTQDFLEIRPQSADSYWKISERYYGDGQYFRYLDQLNRPRQKSEQLPDVVLVPPLKQLLEISVSLSNSEPKSRNGKASGMYPVREGETLFEIAREELGSAARYLEIIRLNRDTLPDNCTAGTRLKSGTMIKLPDLK